MKRIDIRCEFPVVIFDDKVSGQSDSRDRLAQPARHFDVNHRERDRNSRAAIQNIVEATVARIVVVDFVAVEAEIAEQVIVRYANKLAPVGGSGKTRRDFGCDPVQNSQRWLWIQIRHFYGSDFQRRHVQPAVRLVLNCSRSASIYPSALFDSRHSEL